MMTLTRKFPLQNRHGRHSIRQPELNDEPLFQRPHNNEKPASNYGGKRRLKAAQNADQISLLAIIAYNCSSAAVKSSDFNARKRDDLAIEISQLKNAFDPDDTMNAVIKFHGAVVGSAFGQTDLFPLHEVHSSSCGSFD
ncbi:unnamed protein product [Soboliphyme baturini]|uniref:Uncharacterized protein n=1 Tax=Soboliphyme baturini TaxID=241478 RepID=A0A183IQ75_9BILA|nr:unnamed protein product [Soboliphyme baturini]